MASAALAAGPVASLVPATQNLSTPVGATFNPSPIVLVYDSSNNLLSGVSVTFTTPSSGPSGLFSNGTHAITVVSSAGQAGAVLTANNHIGTYTVGVAALGANFQIISTSITVTNLGPTLLFPVATQNSIQIGNNYHISLSATVTDQLGHYLPGYVVTFVAPTSGPSGLFDPNQSTSYSAATDSSGGVNVNFTPNNLVGPYTIALSLLEPDSTILTASLNMANLGPPVHVTPAAGTTPQAAITGSLFGFPLIVTVTDAANQPLPAVPVSYQVTPSVSGIWVPATSSPILTDESGVAGLNVTAGTLLGSYTVTATAGKAGAIFNLTNLAIPASITPLPGTTPQSAPVGTAFQPLGVNLRDAFNNPLAGYKIDFIAPTVGATATTGGSSLVRVVTDSNGNASAPFQANSVTGSYTVYAYPVVVAGLSVSFALTNTAAAIAPTVTQNPANVTVNVGGTAQFTAAASGSPAPTVQWQQSTDGGATFTNMAGAASSPLSFAVSATQNGYLYRSVFTNSGGSATTTAATLTVHSAPAITLNPANLTVVAGATAQFTTAASGIPTPAVQWQQSTDGGSTFTNISGAASATLSFAATSAQSGYLFRAVFTNSAGSATTTAATLTVQAGPTITQNPSNVTVNAGATAQFTAAASGSPAPTVQWQQSTDGGGTFADIAGATSTTLSFAVSATQNGYLYRSVFTNSGGSATTTAATLTVHSAPAITLNPANLSVSAGAVALFTAAATGNPIPGVQWQQSTDNGNTFTNIGSATSTTLSLTAALAQNGYRFRAVFTNSVGSATTTTATLTVHVPLAPCDLTGDGSADVLDVQRIVNEALGAATLVDDLTGDGVVNVIDVQIELNAALRLGCSKSNGAQTAPSLGQLQPLVRPRPGREFDPFALPLTVTDLGAVDGVSTTAYGINNLGQVVGASAMSHLQASQLVCQGRPCVSRAFLWDAGRMTDLKLPVDGSSVASAAFSINDSGDIAGDYWLPGQPGGSFVYAAGQFALLNVQGSRVGSINNAGQIVGDLQPASVHSSAAFRWKAGSVTTLETFSGCGARASAINDVGQVVGSACVRDDSALHAFLYDGVAGTDLGTLGGTNSVALAINVAGQVVGASQTINDRLRHAFLYSKGMMVDLGTLGGADSLANGINSHGLIVGSATTTSGEQHAFLWIAGRMLDLNSLATLREDAVLVEATAINDVGQLVVNASNGRAYLINLPAQLQ